LGDCSTHDVVVVGAGFTGLAAATELKAAGLDVVLVEARDRFGGKVEAQANGLGELVDTGGQFFCDDMVEVADLARRHGKTFVETSLEGAFITQPRVSENDLERVYAQSTALRQRLKNDVAGPALTVADWLDRQPESADAKAAFRSMIEGLWCLALEDIPAWHLADTDRRVTNQSFELQYFLRETMHSLAVDLAADLGGPVRLGTPVHSIHRGPDGVSVLTHGETIAARAVLVALPASMAARIAFAPALPEPLAAALGAWRSGTVIKALARYERPFWREAGLSGMVAWRDIHGLFCCDASPDDGHAALVVFIGGPLALTWQGSDAELRQRILFRLTAALGPEAATPLDLSWRDWSGDAWTGGGYGDLIVDASARDAEDIIRAGIPPIHFAFSE
jgi:monoamine oxidase